MADTLSKQLDKAIAEARLLPANRSSYVLDLIEVLKPHKNGLSRKEVIAELRHNREQKGLPVPEHYLEQTVQSMFNFFSHQSLVFAKRKASRSEGLFFSVGGKGSGVWALDIERARAWLTHKNQKP